MLGMDEIMHSVAFGFFSLSIISLRLSKAVVFHMNGSMKTKIENKTSLTQMDQAGSL